MPRLIRAVAIVVLISLLGFAVAWSLARWRSAAIQQFRADCQKLQKAEDWKALEANARRWNQADPGTAESGIFLAIALQEQGKLPESAQVLTNLPDKDPKTIPALLELSGLQFGPLNRPWDGIATCERILRHQPRILEAHRRLIFFSAITLRRAEMTNRIYRSIELGSEPREAYVYLMLGEVPVFTNGFETANHWLQNDPESEVFLVARTVQIAETLSNLKEPTAETRAQLDQAIRLLMDYRERFPENRAALWFFLSRAARDSRVDDVGQLLAQVPESAGDEAVFWRYRGWFSAQRSDIEQAEQAYRTAAELTPLDASIWHELADVLRRQGKLTEADTMQEVAAVGRQLRLELQKQKDAAAVTDEQLNRIRVYAEACGDRRVGTALRRRLRIPLTLESD